MSVSGWVSGWTDDCSLMQNTLLLLTFLQWWSSKRCCVGCLVELTNGFCTSLLVSWLVGWSSCHVLRPCACHESSSLVRSLAFVLCVSFEISNSFWFISFPFNSKILRMWITDHSQEVLHYMPRIKLCAALCPALLHSSLLLLLLFGPLYQKVLEYGTGLHAAFAKESVNY